MRKLSTVIMFAMTISLAHAQYEIEWYKMGGGGASAGGGYEVTGTIGQQDVGRSTGGDYELVAGFWAFAIVVQSEDGPQLKIRYLSPTEALIYWEAGGDPAILQRNTDLTDEAGWDDDPGTPVFEEDEYRLIVTPGSVPHFYRLRRN
jgi:hypothetical protein